MAEYQDIGGGRYYSPLIERGSDNVPRSVSVPTAAELRGMSTAERYATMTRYGWIDPADKEIELQRAYLSRFDITPASDPEKFRREMRRLAEAESKPHLLGAARRAMGAAGRGRGAQ